VPYFRSAAQKLFHFAKRRMGTTCRQIVNNPENQPQKGGENRSRIVNNHGKRKNKFVIVSASLETDNTRL
jgi:hypothetical protein